MIAILTSVIPAQIASAAVKLNKSKLTLDVGDSFKLKLSESIQGIKWSTNDKAVATVSKGTVEAVAGGSAVITATVGKKQYKCSVTVKDKKVDIIYTAYIFDSSSIEEYVENYKKDNPDIMDVKKYDDEHIIVTIWESERLLTLKEFEKRLDDYLNELILNEDYEGIFTDIEADRFLQNIKVFAIKEKYDNSFASLGLFFALGIMSDIDQAVNLIDPDKRMFNLTIIDEATGEVLYPE
jgi:hypothetical protein